MLIGELSQKAGVTKEAIRHYMDIGLLQPTQKQAGTRNYNEFSKDDLIRLDYITVSKSLGFTLKELQVHIGPYLDNALSESDIKSIFETKLTQVETKIAELETIRTKLINKMIEA